MCPDLESEFCIVAITCNLFHKIERSRPFQNTATTPGSRDILAVFHHRASLKRAVLMENPVTKRYLDMTPLEDADLEKSA